MPLFWISLAFLCGILISSSLTIPIAGWLLIAGMGLILLIPPISRRINSRLPTTIIQFTQALKFSSPTLIPLLVIFFSLGAIRYQLAQPRIGPAFIAFYNGQPGEYLVDGVILEPPDVRDTYVNIRLTVEQAAAVPVQAEAAEFIPVHGLLLARLPPGASIAYGDRVQLQGKLETPPENEDFSYRDYLANHGIYSTMFYPATSLLQQDQGNPFLPRCTLSGNMRSK
jgi:hypothetical protein